MSKRKMMYVVGMKSSDPSRLGLNVIVIPAKSRLDAKRRYAKMYPSVQKRHIKVIGVGGVR